MKQKSNVKRVGTATPKNAETAILTDVRKLIESTRVRIGQNVNSELTMLYWKVGHRIREEILKEKQVGCGQEIISTLSEKLIPDYGIGFSDKNLQRMIQFAEMFSDKKIVVSLKERLTWTHFITLIPLKNQL